MRKAEELLAWGATLVREIEARPRPKTRPLSGLSPTGFAAHAKPPSVNDRMAAIARKNRLAFVGNA